MEQQIYQEQTNDLSQSMISEGSDDDKNPSNVSLNEESDPFQEAKK